MDVLKLIFICGIVACKFVNAERWDVYGCPVLLQETCDSKLVRFFMTTPDSATHELLSPEFTLPSSFNPQKPSKIVIHGLGNFLMDSVTLNIWESYAKLGYNVIMVNWSELSKSPCYVASAVDTVYVGQCVGEMLIKFTKHSEIQYENLHLIGFSLGAHVSGFASNYLMETTGNTVGRISGLDPAMPLFTWDEKYKLDYTDANFVDIIHTCAGSFGKIEATGHVDFYVNGGSSQPMCTNGNVFDRAACSHGMAGIYFAESIISEKQFIAIECPNLFNYLLGWCKNAMQSAVMGERTSISSRGIFYLDTALEPPYALDNAIYRAR